MLTLPIPCHKVNEGLTASRMWWYQLQNVLGISIQSSPSYNHLTRSLACDCCSRQCLEEVSPISLVGGALPIPLALLCTSSAIASNHVRAFSRIYQFLLPYPLMGLCHYNNIFWTRWWVFVFLTVFSVVPVDGSSSLWRHPLYPLMGLRPRDGITSVVASSSACYWQYCMVFTVLTTLLCVISTCFRLRRCMEVLSPRFDHY